jgi:tRNA/rRNA methyltransferase
VVKDRRFASLGFKRQVPVGPHITDLVSFPLRTVIDLVPGDESAEAKAARAEKRNWLADRNYRIIEVRDVEVEHDLPRLLDRLNAAILQNRGLA